MGFLLNSNIISILVIILFKSTCIIAPATHLIFTVHNALLNPSANSKPSLAHQPSFSSKTHQMGNGHLAIPNSLSSSSSLKITSDGKPKIEHMVKAAPSDGYGHGDHNSENENLEGKMLELEKDPAKLAELMKNLLNDFQASIQNTATDKSKKPNEPIIGDILTYAAKGILDKEEEGEDRSQFHLPLGRLAFADEEIKRIEKFLKFEDRHKILKEFKEFSQKLKHLGVANYDTILSSIYAKVKRDELEKVVFDLLNLKIGSHVSQSVAKAKYDVHCERIQAANELVGQLKIPEDMKKEFLERQQNSTALLTDALLIGDKCKFW